MKQQRIKKTACIMSAVFALLFSLLLSTYASAEPLYNKRTGSVTVEMNDPHTGKAISGGVVALYRVGSAVENSGAYEFKLTADFAESKLSLKNVNSPENAEKLAAFANKNNFRGKSKTIGGDGKAVYNNLKTGLYMVVQTEAANGYDIAKPFLVTLPMNENGAYIYDVTAAPKTEIIKLVDISVKKIWNGGKAADRPKSVTVKLLKDKKVINTAVLNESNSWSYMFKDLPESDLYSILEENVPKGYTASYKQDEYAFTVTNTASLIQTGQLIWPIPVLITVGVLLLVIGIALVRRKKNRA